MPDDGGARMEFLKAVLRLAQGDEDGQLLAIRAELEQPEAPDASTLIATLIGDEALDPVAGFALLARLTEEETPTDAAAEVGAAPEGIDVVVFIDSNDAFKPTVEPGLTVGGLRELIAGTKQRDWSALPVYHVDPMSAAPHRGPLPDEEVLEGMAKDEQGQPVQVELHLATTTEASRWIGADGWETVAGCEIGWQLFSAPGVDTCFILIVGEGTPHAAAVQEKFLEVAHELSTPLLKSGSPAGGEAEGGRSLGGRSVAFFKLDTRQEHVVAFNNPEPVDEGASAWLPCVRVFHKGKLYRGLSGRNGAMVVRMMPIFMRLAFDEVLKIGEKVEMDFREDNSDLLDDGGTEAGNA